MINCTDFLLAFHMLLTLWSCFDTLTLLFSTCYEFAGLSVKPDLLSTSYITVALVAMKTQCGGKHWVFWKQ